MNLFVIGLLFYHVHLLHTPTYSLNLFLFLAQLPLLLLSVLKHQHLCSDTRQILKGLPRVTVLIVILPFNKVVLFPKHVFFAPDLLNHILPCKRTRPTFFGRQFRGHLYLYDAIIILVDKIYHIVCK